MAPNPTLNADGHEKPKFFTANKVEFKFGQIQAPLPFSFPLQISPSRIQIAI
jgi:hypothetical protein